MPPEPAYDALIIGAGPAGIGAALALKSRGIHNIALLERETDAGGTPRHCGHPPFGLREFRRLLTGPAYAKRLARAAFDANIPLLPRHSVLALHPGGTLDLATPEGPRTLTARRVLIATGAREAPRAARLIGGERPLGVLNTGALQAYCYLEHKAPPFTRPVVVGTELVSLSALLTLRRHGIHPVAVLESGPTPVAPWPLSLFPRLLGLPVHRNAALASINGFPRVTSVTLQNGSELACDGVLLTGRFTPESTLARMSHLALSTATKGPAIDQYGRTSDPAFFAAGNQLRAIETAGWCFFEGRRIGEFMADDLQGGLPAPGDELTLTPGEGIAYVVPQRLARVSPLRATLQLRLTEPALGQLHVRAGDTVLLRRPLISAPERRVLLELDDLRPPPGTQHLTIEVAQ
ncbi:FAD/NAD(P)-binding oxidoreductase [Acidocella sp.]|uniref:NAD(P)/FAD-dependent oxidoreductase n=1 Tax=Acidocella sp. TaxID=50710 RepID=UPI00261C38CA|nr:FAD-dependent oxidoreductase [Acidocella sp.]